MASLKHILLVSYVFPPYYGIGGRRWAKHASELTKLGYVVHVICARNAFDEKSLWWDLVKDNPNIRIYQLPRRYPKVLIKFEHNVLQKIFYKFWITVLPFLTKGSYLDRTIFWEKIMLRKARKLITKYGINHVICTGAPFGAMYQVTKLRKWFHDIFIMNDLRDPWTWGPNWGFPNLESKRMGFELYKERTTFRNSDIITVPTQEMKVSMDINYPEFSQKVILLEHFVDTDGIDVLAKTKSDKVRMIMYGNIYHHIPELIEEAAKTLGNYKANIILDIYTDKQRHKEIFAKYGASNVTFYDQLPEKELFSRFKDYDYVFLMIPQVGVDHISTKFYEIIYSKTPFLIFCKYGLGPKFILDNNLGLHAETGHLKDTLDKLVLNKNMSSYNYSFDVTNYTLKSNALRVNEILVKNNNFSSPEFKNLKNILITFDYELFLGQRSGTVDNCIINPTNLILNILQKHNIQKSLFFIDTVYIKRLQSIDNSNARKDYKKIEEQLVAILKQGHLLFPHLHPHWLDAKYIDEINQWELLSIDKYRFHHIDEATRDNLFEHSVSYIKHIQHQAEIFYPINGYRAGGWCLQPFSDFKPFFLKHGITNDFSVLKQFRNTSENTYYDFTNVPRKALYRFNDRIEEEDNEGIFKEYTISYITVKHKLINRVFSKYLSAGGIVSHGDGVSVRKPENQVIKDADESNSDSFKDYEMVSAELLRITRMSDYKKLIEHNSYIHFISHPKMLNAHNLKCFDSLLGYIRSMYTIQTDFEKMN